MLRHFCPMQFMRRNPPDHLCRVWSPTLAFAISTTGSASTAFEHIALQHTGEKMAATGPCNFVVFLGTDVPHLDGFYDSYSELPVHLSRIPSVKCMIPPCMHMCVGVAKVVLKKGKTQLFRDGSPMVYSGAVDCVIGKPPQTGDVVLLTDGTRKPFAWGIYNSVSMFCVRVMQMEDEASRDPSCVLDMEQLIKMRINAAVELRKQLGFPSSNTNVYRLVNSEGDRLSGLIADVLGDHVVVASSASWVEKYRTTIEQALTETTGFGSITWRPSVDILKEEGIDLENLPDLVTEFSAPSEDIEVVENGIRFKASLSGQKTGFYADQRDSRLLLRSLCQNRTVLDLCCYSGGFSLNAAVGGASHVTGVDSSGPAIELAAANATLNQLDPSSSTFVKADITIFLKDAIANGRAWDVVVLDPPKLAPNRKVLSRAIARYRSLNALAMRVTKQSGLLMTCSCSGAMTQSGAFLSVLKDASVSVGRRLIQLRYAGAAPDHTLDVAYPEGAYLTNTLLRVL